VILFSLIASVLFQGNGSVLKSKLEKSDLKDEKMLGIDANYVSAMQDSIYRWRYGSTPINIYPFFKEKGVNYHRLRIFVKDEGPDSLLYATNTAKIVQNLGMQCSITLFFK
jgi:arabinogalactan endo-1,4-beta-galactosidase